MSSEASTPDVRNMGPLIGSLCQETKRTRFLVFSGYTSELLTFHETPLNLQTFQDLDTGLSGAQANPEDILSTSIECINRAVDNLEKLGYDPLDIVTLGIANQRETVILWNKKTGKSLCPAILWHDTRSRTVCENLINKISIENNSNYLRYLTGLPIHSQFSAPKIRWCIDKYPAVRLAVAHNECMFGTVDSWLIWNFSGGSNGGVHVTDVTNASRTSLMNLCSRKWEPYLCNFFGVPLDILPEIRSSSEIYANLSISKLKGIPIGGCIGDHQASLIGQTCWDSMTLKCSYDSVNSLLLNVGILPDFSNPALLSTIAYQLGPDSLPIYALEGIMTEDGMEYIYKLFENEKLNKENYKQILDENTNDLYFVPSFSGFASPRWDPYSRGLIIGLTLHTSKFKIIRAFFEALAYQTREVLDSYGTRREPRFLRIDGELTKNDTFPQILADILGIDVVRPYMSETTALGAAIMAGKAGGIEVWDSEFDRYEGISDKFIPKVSKIISDHKYLKWKEAVNKCEGWTSKKKVLLTKSERISRASCFGVYFITSVILQKIADYIQEVI